MINERKEILKALEAGPLILDRLVRGLDDASLRARPAAGEWAIVEVVAHLADTDERTLGRTRSMLAEDEPWLEPYDPAVLAEERRYLAMDIDSRAWPGSIDFEAPRSSCCAAWPTRAGSGSAIMASTAASRFNSWPRTPPARTPTTSRRSPG